jgi:hypothetical protein
MNGFHNLTAIDFLARERRERLIEEAQVARQLRAAGVGRRHAAAPIEGLALTVAAGTLAALLAAQSVLAAAGGGGSAGPQLLM